jgi:hypothetical protein
VIGAGVWYYFSQVHPTKIEKIVSNPTAYTGKRLLLKERLLTGFFLAFSNSIRSGTSQEK